MVRANQNRASAVCAALVLTWLGAASSVHADDIDIYTTPAHETHNILFVLDVSGSMSYDLGPAGSGTGIRIDALKTAFTQVLSDPGLTNVNVGIQTFNTTTAIRWPVSPIDALASDVDPNILTVLPDNMLDGELYTVRRAVIDAVNNLYPQGGTAIADALHEAYLYYSGVQWDRGVIGSDPTATGYDWAVSGTTLTTTEGYGMQAINTHPTAYTGDGIYESPLSQPHCTADAVNHIVILSDGTPTFTQTMHDIGALTGGSCATTAAGYTAPAGSPDSLVIEKECNPALAALMYNNDIDPALTGTNIKVHAIGLSPTATLLTLLDPIAAAGGTGQAYVANDASSLAAAFSAIVGSSTPAQTFTGATAGTEPGRFATSPETYVSVFNPTEAQSWEGNLKGYYYSGDGLQYDSPVSGAREDATEVVDGITIFKDEAMSFWSSAADGGEIAEGGAREQLPAARNLLTDYGIGGGSALASFSAVQSSLTAADFGGVDGATVTTWLNDTAGIADSLHADPQIVFYGSRKVAYLPTNQGVLHAFDITDNDTSGGDEIFAFIPEAQYGMFKNRISGQDPAETPLPHFYGLDGQIGVWSHDADADGAITPGASGDFVYLLMGSRRGGSTYYVLDVTDPDNPKLHWKISDATTGFSRLGQSWSRLALAKLADPTDPDGKVVAVFGGGYDVDRDTRTSRSTDSVGNSVFIVDFESGALLREITGTSTGATAAMQYAIAADLSPVDSTGDGLTDRLYAADLGGQLWRFDLEYDGSAVTTDAYRIANIADGSAAENDRMFFYPPAVTFSRDGTVYLSIGSGNRTKPLEETVENRFYVFKDALDPPTAAISETDLVNLTTITEVDATTRANLESKDGWYIQLAEGEKAIEYNRVYDYRLLFTTYTPPDSSGGSSATLTCEAPTGTNLLYVVDLLNAEARGDFRRIDPSSPDPLARAEDLTVGGIAGIGVLVANGDGEVALLGQYGDNLGAPENDSFEVFSWQVL